jgi:hypothetical protein
LLLVSEAEWGVPRDGLQLRVSSAKRVYGSGEGVDLNIFAKNLTAQSMAVRAIDPKPLDVSIKGDVVVFTLGTLDARIVDVGPKQAAYWTILDRPELVPGKYQVRVVLVSPEHPAEERAAWHGTVSSNTESFEVK